MWGRRRGRPASVQGQLPLEEIRGDVLVLRGGACRAVLETGALPFELRPEAEQEAILAGYRRFLNGLSYPLQVLVRVVPADVEGYVSGLERARRAGGELARLALDHEAFVRRVARERSLLDRRFFVVVPAEEGPVGVRAGLAASSLLPRRRASGRGADNEVARAERTLSGRCSEVTSGLAAFGVPARRLGGGEIAALWRSALGHRHAWGAAAPEWVPIVRGQPAGEEDGGA